MPFEQHLSNNLGPMVADHVSAMLAYWDKNEICKFANKAYLEWFGKTVEEMVEKITLSELLGPLYEKNAPYIKGALAGHTQMFERDIVTPRGVTRRALANYFPHIVDGEVRGFFVHVADITPIKMLEDKLVKTNEIVTEQNKRLLNFANVVSHNLRSYANNFQALLRLHDVAETENEKGELLSHLKTISIGFSETVKNLNEIVDAQNLGDLSPVKINLKDYVDRAISILRTQIHNCHADVQNEIDSDVTIQANPAYVESIVLNFLTNAIKYRHPHRKPVVKFSTSSISSRGELLLQISDNGLGIDLKKHGNDLFKMYKTFHENADAKGVGLFIVKFQVESMGGKIEVESEVGVGTTFRVYFKSI